MDNENNKDVEKVENVVESSVGQDTSAPKTNGKTKIIVFSIVGVILAIAIISGIIALIVNAGKPSKKQAEKVVKSYLEAISEKDEDGILKQIDMDGYVILKEEGEKKFDKKYKEKGSYVKKYMDKNYIDDKDELGDKIVYNEKAVFGNSYGSYEYSLKEITSVKKSSKSGKVAIIKAKISKKTSSGKDTVTLRLYVMKKDGKYKVIGSEIV